MGKNPEEEYKVKLDQLEKLGHTDRAKNLQHLKLYAGDVNKVIQDYMLQKPSSSQSLSPNNEKTQTTAPKPVKKDKPKPIIQQQSQIKNPPKAKQSEPMKKEEIKPKVIETKPIKTEESKQQIPKTTMPKPILKSEEAKTNVSTSSKPIILLNNLSNLISSDLRQLLINIGEPMIAEIIFSNSINGQNIYNYDSINLLLKQFNVSFGDETSYESLLQQMEKCYQKNGVVDIYNRDNMKLSEELKESVVDEKNDLKKESEYELLKQNISNLIASDVMLLIMPYNVELAQRLFAFSINGNDLCKFDYDGVVFATGINPNIFSKDDWNRMVDALDLPESEPFDAAKWKKLQKNQESVIAKAEKISKQIQNMQKQNKLKNNKQKQKQPKVCKKQVVNANKSEKERLNKIVELEQKTDAFLPKKLLNVKQRQINTLTTLYDMAAIIGLDAKIISKIEASARKQSEKQLADYLKFVNVSSSKESNNNSFNAKDIEKRQLELLSTINSTRNKLEQLAKSKGVSLDELCLITDTMKVNESEINLDVLSKGFDALFSNLADMAVTVQQTAKQYGVKLEDNELDKHIVPMYNELERKQNALIAQCNYFNDRAKMIA